MISLAGHAQGQAHQIDATPLAFRFNLIDQFGAKVLRESSDPYYLNPKGQRPPEDVARSEGDFLMPRWDETQRRWAAPFIMAPVNTRVVRRSQALLGFPFGRPITHLIGVLLGIPFVKKALNPHPPAAPGERMSYFEAAAAPNWLAAMLVSGATAFFGGILAIGPLRRLVRKLLPKPGGLLPIPCRKLSDASDCIGAAGIQARAPAARSRRQATGSTGWLLSRRARHRSGSSSMWVTRGIRGTGAPAECCWRQVSRWPYKSRSSR